MLHLLEVGDDNGRMSVVAAMDAGLFGRPNVDIGRKVLAIRGSATQ